MTHSNGNAPSGLADVTAALDVLISAKEAEVEVAAARLAELREELRPMYAMQRAATGTGPGRKPGKAKVKLRHGDEELAIVVTKLRGLDQAHWADPEVPGSFAARTLREIAGVSESQSDRMVRALREREQIRLVGERRIGRGTRASRVYVLNDE